MTKEEQLFLLAFRTAEAIYRKPGQSVKSQAEILAEMPIKLENFNANLHLKEGYKNGTKN